MRFKLCEIVTKVEYLSDDKLKEALNNNAIRDYAYIVHHSDKKEDGTLKDMHYHICLRLKNSYDSKYIANWFGLSENFVSKCKSNWGSMLKYLTHANAPTKFQYPDSEVISNFDWKESVEKVGKKKDFDERKQEIINRIANGEIREYNYFEEINAVENDKYYNSIQKAFKYRNDTIRGVKRSMECVFITGDSGVGKTSYAQQVATDKGYSVFVSSGSNDVLDGYGGQDCIILDELRPSCMGLSDLLKMLDNHTASSVKSRYKNKVLECKMIIITTVLDIDTFFNNVFSEEKETAVQLKRRCTIHIRMEKDYFYMKIWQPKSRCYSQEFRQVNPIPLQYKIQDYTKEEAYNKMSEILGLAKNYVDYAKENYAEFDNDLEKLTPEEENEIQEDLFKK